MKRRKLTAEQRGRIERHHRDLIKRMRAGWSVPDYLHVDIHGVGSPFHTGAKLHRQESQRARR